MTPVNATTQMAEDDLRLEPAPGRVIRPSAEAMERGWTLRGVQDDLRPPAPDEDDEAILAAMGTIDTELVAPPAPAAPAPQPAASAPAEETSGKRDWSSALDLVQEAHEAIRIGEERVQELERQAHQSREDIKALQLQIQASERRYQAAENRASRAEARAAEAESWLARLHDAITMSFSRVSKTTNEG